MLCSKNGVQSLDLLSSEFKLIFIFDHSPVCILEFSESSFEILIFSLEVADGIFIVGYFLIELELVFLSDIEFRLFYKFLQS